MAFASGSAFIISQVVNVTIFHRLDKIFMPKGIWWMSSLISTFFSGIFDTLIFFTLAFSSLLSFWWSVDPYVVGEIMWPFDITLPRWVGWATGDFSVKIFLSIFMLLPFRCVTSKILSKVDV